MKLTIFVLLGFSVFLASSEPRADAATVTQYLLPLDTNISGISGDGRTVFGTGSTGGFLWTVDGGMIDLGDLAPKLVSQSGAYKIASRSSYHPDHGYRDEFFRLDQNNHPTSLGYDVVPLRVLDSGVVVTTAQSGLGWTYAVTGDGSVFVGSIDGPEFTSEATGSSWQPALAASHGPNGIETHAGLSGLPNQPETPSGARSTRIIAVSDAGSEYLAEILLSDTEACGLFGGFPACIDQSWSEVYWVGEEGNSYLGPQSSYYLSGDGQTVVGFFLQVPYADFRIGRWGPESGWESIEDLVAAEGQSTPLTGLRPYDPESGAYNLGYPTGVSYDGSTIVVQLQFGDPVSGTYASRGWIVSISQPTTEIPGDFDHDGNIDGRDFLAWQRNPNVGNLSDWQASYGTNGLGALSVPEPSTILLVVSLSGIIGTRRVLPNKLF